MTAEKDAGQEGGDSIFVYLLSLLKLFPFVWMPINETDTPAQLEMEAEDTTDVFQWKTRGFYQRGNLLLNSRILFLQTKKIFSVRTLQFGSTTS